MKSSGSTMAVRPDIDNLTQQHPPQNLFPFLLSSYLTTLSIFETKNIQETFVIKLTHTKKTLLLALSLGSSQM